MTAVISENAEKILKTRYLTNGESIDEMFRRVSLGNDKYYRLMRELKFLPNSPTLFNAGLKNGCTLSACFTADTVIHTLAGDFTVAELLERGDKEFEVFSTNGRRLKIGRAFALRQTKSNAKVYRVTFDTGDSIKLTADHLVMMRDVSYKEVRHLKEGDSVMPFNHGREKGRRYVFKRIDSGYTLAYQWAFKQKTGRTVKRGCEVHHVNLDKTDDRTTNLVEMSESDHKRLHRLGDLNPMKKPEVAAKISEQMMGNQRGVGPKPGTAEAMIGNQHALRTEPHPDKRKQYQREWARKKSRERRGLYNHKVVSVEYVGREDVYDLSVHKYHNFAANGIFIHNCFVFDIEDSMFGKNSIVETRAKAIAVAKAGGGVGYYFGKLRSKDSLIKSVHRKACGPVAVLRDMHGVRQLITQGGKRDLAQMGVLNVEHENIRDFIHCKDEDPKALESFNLSVGWSDRAVYQAFVEADDQGEYYHKLWREQCESAWKTGCPGMLFPDVINKFNPNKHLGLINATNPCGETPNRSDEPCNLGSQSIARYIDLKTRKFRREEFLADTYTCTLFLDDILDANEFPHPDIEAAALLTRKLGLGIMGWADFLSLQGIQYDSPEALLLADSIMKDVKEVNLKARRDRAKEKGPYKGWSDLSEQEMLRNETGTSIAPTGTIAIIADVWGSIEPYFMFDGERTTFEGIKMNDGVPQWVRERLDGFVPKTAAQITPADHVRMQAAFQKHVDLGVSKTVNLPNSASVKDVSDTYKLMHDLGCKGGTIYRDGCRAEQVLRAKSTKTSVYLSVDAGGGRRHLPATRTSKTHKFTIDNVRGFLTVGEYQDGTPGELFLRFSKVGSTVSGMLDSWAMMVSLGLQHGVPLESIIRLNSGIRFEPAGLTGNKEVPVCSSIVDYVVRWMEREYLGPKPKDKTDSVTMSGQMCPDCGHELIYQAGCLSCIKAGCNWQKCG